jgi:hypothetical protein
MKIQDIQAIQLLATPKKLQSFHIEVLTDAMGSTLGLYHFLLKTIMNLS